MQPLQRLVHRRNQPFMHRVSAGLLGTVAIASLASCAGPQPPAAKPEAAAPAPESDAPQTTATAPAATPPAATTPAPESAAPQAAATPTPESAAPAPATQTPTVSPATAPASTTASANDSTQEPIQARPLNSAAALMVLESGCRMGQCVEVHYQGKALVEDTGTERLYNVITQTYIYPSEEYQQGEFHPKAATQQILCSTERPLAVYQASATDLFSLNYLNPGSAPPGYLVETDMLYWLTCHDEAGPLVHDAALEQTARDLGYPLNLEMQQFETDFLEFFEG